MDNVVSASQEWGGSLHSHRVQAPGYLGAASGCLTRGLISRGMEAASEADESAQTPAAAVLKALSAGGMTSSLRATFTQFTREIDAVDARAAEAERALTQTRAERDGAKESVQGVVAEARARARARAERERARASESARAERARPSLCARV